MKTSAFRILPLLVAGLFAAGCVVRSIQPWLSDESRVKEPSLVGAWHDAKATCTAFFSESDDSDCDYDVLLVTDNQDVSRFTASLHKLDELHVLTVGPAPEWHPAADGTMPAADSRPATLPPPITAPRSHGE